MTANAKLSSILGVFGRTLPYVGLRALAYALLGLALLVFLGVVGLIGLLFFRLFEGAALPLLIAGVLAIGGAMGIKRLAERYILYLIKIGHVAVIMELVRTGSLPDGVNQIEFGRQKVTQHFGSATALFGVDQIVEAAVRQVLVWLTRRLRFLTAVPAGDKVLRLARRLLMLTVGYVDEAVMSYVMAHEDQDVWQASADGVVLYAQSWKQMLQTAAVLLAVTLVFWVILFLVLMLPLLALARILFAAPETQALGGALALGAAVMLTNVFKWLLVDPLATTAMVVTYNEAISDQTPSVDLRGQITAISPRFRTLLEKAGQPTPAESQTVETTVQGD